VGTNRYAYAENDPINKSDPNGHTSDPGYETASEFAYNQAHAGTSTSGEMATSVGFGGEPTATVGRAGDQDAGIQIASVFSDPISRQILMNLVDLPEIVSNEWDIRSIGKAGEALVRQSIIDNGFTIVGEQVHVRLESGELRIIDFVISDRKGGYAAIEAKANTATRSAEQIRKDDQLATQGGYVRSPGIDPLPVGTHIKLHTTEISVCVNKGEGC
jgi:hypothetical protein